MKKIGLQMSVLMGVTMSFGLSLVGNLISGHFTLPGFLISFIVSLILSLIIGFFIPMPKLEELLCRELHIEQRSMQGNVVTALISDLIYTTVITLAATALAYPKMVKAGGSASFGAMFVGSLLPSLVIGFLLIFLLKPLFLKLVLKQNGIDSQHPARPDEGDKE